MRRSLVLAALLVAGCNRHERASVGPTSANDAAPDVSIDVGGGGSVAANNGAVAIDVPGFQAKVSLPEFKIGSETIDFDGMKIAPGSKITGVNIDAKSDDKRTGVRMGFTNDQTPTGLTAYYRTAATNAGFTVVDTPTGLHATKPGSDIAIDIAPAGTGSSGKFTVLDR